LPFPAAVSRTNPTYRVIMREPGAGAVCLMT
jgi:hypothetical protein